MTYYLHLCVFVFISFGISLNLSAQTPYSKPAPYKSVQDYQDAHPQPKYTPDRPTRPSSSFYNETRTTTSGSNETRTTTSGSKDKPVDNTLKSSSDMIGFLKIRDEPVTEEEDKASMKMAEELLNLIESASNNYKGYLGKIRDSGVSCNACVSYGVINTEFLPAIYQGISTFSAGNLFTATIVQRKIEKSVYLAVVKQIPILTSATLKYEFKERILESGEYHFGLYTNSGFELLSLMIYKNQFDLDIHYIKHYNISDYNDKPVGSTIKLSSDMKGFLEIKDEPVTEEENKASLKMAEELLKMIESASNNYKGYLGKTKKTDVSNKVYISYDVINTDFLPAIYQGISMFSGGNLFTATIVQRKIEKSVYLAVVKQIPILTSATLKYELKERILESGEYHYGLYTNSGFELLSLMIYKNQFDLDIHYNSRMR
jgi:hypothetical protein